MNKTLVSIVGSAVIIGGITVGVLTLSPNQPAPASQSQVSSTDSQTVAALRDQADYDCSKKGVTVDTSNLDGKVIYDCNFSQSSPDTHVFPDNMTNATFVCSQLDNVFIPTGNTIINEIDGIGCGSRLRYKTNPADGQDWIVDSNDNYVQPLNQ